MNPPVTALGASPAPATAARLHPYPERVLADLRRQLPWEVEYLQAVEEVFSSLGPVLDRNPRYEHEAILERMVVPERIISFRVCWTDDEGHPRVNNGWRVQFNGALGPYKGGTRFHASVNQSSLKFLGFEQMFKNALTGLALGAGKGGADLDFRRLSETETMRFCQAYMSELVHHIGPHTDVPAGDIGVGTREIGYLFGQYRRLTHRFEGAITGKAPGWGGSLLRPEATGFGVAYFAQELFASQGRSLEGCRVAVSGFGNVAWGVVSKLDELGAKVVTLSGPDGFVHDPDGVSGERIEFMKSMRWSPRDEVAAYAEHFGVEFFPGQRPWSIPVDLAIPAAIQNELGAEDAAALIHGGCRVVVEAANMPVTPEAAQVLRDAGVVHVPGKAANAGGVAVSALEMNQNASHQQWTAEKVDQELRSIMMGIHARCVAVAADLDRPGDYAAGANVGGFLRVADAMLDQGHV